MRSLLRIGRHGTALAITAALLLALPATAGATGDLSSFITSVSPAQNGKITIATKPDFQVVSTCRGMALYGYISRTPTLDGLSAFLGGDLQDQFPMADLGTGVYTGTPQGTWLQQAGGYYWQVRTESAQCAGEPAIAWASQPVFIQVIGSTADAGTIDVSQQDNGELLTITQARETIGPAVRQAKKRPARGLKRTCTRRGSGSILAVICTASWSDGKTYSYNGSWRMALNDDGTVEATFNGRRAKLTCVTTKRAQRRSVKACFKKHAFAVTVA